MTAVATRTDGKAAVFAEEHGVEKACDSYEELALSPDVDIVYVGTPDHLHKEHCLMALEAGKHVLCEKALARSMEDAREMYEAA